MPNGSPIPQTPVRSPSLFFPPYSLAGADLLSIRVGFPILDISQKWNHTICGLCVWSFSLSIKIQTW